MLGTNEPDPMRLGRCIVMQRTESPVSRSRSRDSGHWAPLRGLRPVTWRHHTGLGGSGNTGPGAYTGEGGVHHKIFTSLSNFWICFGCMNLMKEIWNILNISWDTGRRVTPVVQCINMRQCPVSCPRWRNEEMEMWDARRWRAPADTPVTIVMRTLSVTLQWSEQLPGVTMTISYQRDVASSTAGGFTRLLFKWKVMQVDFKSVCHYLVVI